MFFSRSFVIALTLLGLQTSHATAQTATGFRTCLALGQVVQGGRNLLHRDPIEALIVAGKPVQPVEGASVGVAKWTKLTADKDGWWESAGFSGGYAFVSVTSEQDKIVLLEAAGHTLVYVNGVPRTGDPYGYGYVRLPIALHKGDNSLLFVVGRGRLRAAVKPVTSPVSLDASDATLPDLRLGEAAKTQGALVVINVSESWLKGARIVTESPDGRKTTRPIPTVPPLGVRKVAFGIETSALKSADAWKCSVHLTDAAGKTLTEPTPLTLRVRRSTETYKRTFVSQIDGSVQYFAVNPASDYAGKIGTRSPLPLPALVLSLHGASVEALGQADAYASKTWAHLVAPTNRRPYGFDWEEIGRLDTLEVLGLAQKELKTDPTRTYLTGHSMGGHGTWQIGVQYPDKFAAIAPSAGWISFFSYAGTQRTQTPSPMEAILQRATNSSDTLALSRNYTNQSIYILHGGADDNVPPSEARTMSRHLATFHKDFQYHEQPGAGHWWSEGDEPGARCVDYPGFFDLFAKRRLPAPDEMRHVEFATANPEVSSQCYWVKVEQQEHPLEISSVDLTLDPHLRRFAGTTQNIRCIQFDTRVLSGSDPVNVTLDGAKLDKIAIPSDRMLTFVKEGAVWKRKDAPLGGQKSALRSGLFKSVFNHRFLLVIGTKGTEEENRWALEKARYDAESFWYRGNGAADIILDTEFDAKREPDRSVVLYGSGETNGAWSALLANSEIEVRRGSVRIGAERFDGENLAVMFVRPRASSSSACVAAISGTGLAGMKLTDRVPLFLSGVGIPDCVVMSPEALTSGVLGVKAAGFFGNDWSVAQGEFVFRR